MVSEKRETMKGRLENVRGGQLEVEGEVILFYRVEHILKLDALTNSTEKLKML